MMNKRMKNKAKRKGILPLAIILLSCLLFGCHRMRRNSEYHVLPGGTNAVLSATQAPPEHLKWLVEDPWRYPDLRIRELKRSDAPDIVRMYQQTTALKDKRCLIWALGMVKGQDAAHLLLNEVTNSHSGSLLSVDEELVLLDAVQVVGLLGAENDEAFAFVKAGVDRQFWVHNRPWRSMNDRNDIRARLMIDASIDGIALTGRPDAERLLEALASRDSAYLKDFGSAITSAMFDYDYVRERGTDAFIRLVCSGGLMHAYMEWVQGERGKKWHEWSLSLARGKSTKIK
jgi:hypothetical protein